MKRQSSEGVLTVRKASKKKDTTKVINLCGERIKVDRNALIFGGLIVFGLIVYISQAGGTVSPSSSVVHVKNVDTIPLATLPPSPLPIPEAPMCTPAEIKRQVDGFMPIKGRVWYWGCSPDSWWELVHSHSPSSADKIFIDIGMNKGYMGAAWYALWNPQVGLTPETLGKAVRTVPPTGDQDCGACGDCTDKVKSTEPNPTKDTLIKVHGFDGAGVTVEKHHKIVRDYFGDIEGYWTSSNMAVGDHVGTIEFPNVLSEVASIHVNEGLSADHKNRIFNDQKMVSVNLTTVDTFMKDWAIDTLFTLKIDTEGNDPSVLKGAQETIKNHRTHILQFEYHNLGLWTRQEDLKTHVYDLDTLGYTCFLLGHDCAHVLTKCWDPVFEFRTWSNIMCISRVKEPKLIESMYAKSYAKQDPSKCPAPKD